MARILVVDDEPRILSLFHGLLRSKGHEVVPEHDGAAAIERIRNERFDLVLSDIRMSPVNGMEVFRFARSRQPDTPVILLTAYGTVSTAIEAMKGGAFDYLTKPFKVDELLAAIRRALSCRGRGPGDVAASGNGARDARGTAGTAAPGGAAGLPAAEGGRGGEAPARGAPPPSGPAGKAGFPSLRAFLKTREREYLRQVLDSVGGDKEAAAGILGISLATLYRKLDEKTDGPLP